MSIEGYIAWRRLTHNGRRSRQQMSPAEQQEYDSFGLGTESEHLTPAEHEEVKALYEAIRGAGA